MVELFGHYEGCDSNLDWKNIYYSNVFHKKKEHALEELKDAKRDLRKLGYDIAIIREVER